MFSSPCCPITELSAELSFGTEMNEVEPLRTLREESCEVELFAASYF